MPDVFISYRRADSSSIAGRMDDQLVARFGRAQVFKDVDSIPPGVNFERYIEGAIQRSAVVLVIIGPRWLNASAGVFRGRRLDDPADFVRIEIETALRLDVTIIPLLSENATMPPAARLPISLRPLVRLNALPVRPDPDFHRDLERVIAAVERWMEEAPTRAQPAVMSPAATPPAATPPATTPSAVTPPVAPTASQPTKRQPAKPQPAQTGFAAARPVAADSSAQTTARTKRPSWLIVVAALVLIAIAAAFPLANKALALPFLAAAPDPTVTAHALATANARQRQIAYVTTHAGPCASTSERYTVAHPFYWAWPDTLPYVTCASGVARVTGLGYLAFNGRESGFPAAFTASWTITFHSRPPATSCVAIYLVGALTNPGITMCDDGASSANGSNVTFPKAPSYVVSLRVTAKDVTFRVNGRQLGDAQPYNHPISALTLHGSVADGASLDMTSFSLTPAT